ncbi:uncharacterized protein LOC123448020 isoform X1 [Hordeum vulgare subsp. vulgare]|uniref:uncharacterized protein LOC123448020 isoform X1 n=1 Tax=Hordeum vulgare subsp. vulgare TaxID=112509 RepID=UPI000B4851D9|nr:uncharacterized protein LOC123448020 isoform X1 [Hordeum vulgare subsp. vulgare]XP_044980716.1 uncharacterized protein LOC123448020 isoform X1 [Hordeum vulgare subsp. vulgare]
MSSWSPPLPPRGAEEEGDTRSGGGAVFSYGEARYWDARYMEEGGAPYDCYQRYAALRPFVRRFVPPAYRLFIIGCGSALMSDDIVAYGYNTCKRMLGIWVNSLMNHLIVPPSRSHSSTTPSSSPITTCWRRRA